MKTQASPAAESAASSDATAEVSKVPPPPFRVTLRVNPVTAAVARTVGALSCRSVKSFVFCASTGRSGTHTLQNLLATVPGCVATFEPDPIMHRQVMRDYNQGDERLMRRVFELRKLPTIYREAAFKSWYVETNHLFIKSFFEPAVEAFRDRMQLIHLVRDKHDVAASLFLRGSMNSKGGGYQFHLDPTAPRNEIQVAALLAPDGPYAHNYYACLWESYEIAARVRRFHQRFPDIRIHRVRSEQLGDFEVARELLRNLGMVVDEDALRSRLNVRLGASHSKPPRPPEVSDEKIASFCALCEELLAHVGPDAVVSEPAPAIVPPAVAAAEERRP